MIETRQGDQPTRKYGLRPKYATKVAVVGTPNVGKSVMFTRLTGHYAAASNYPGTTVEVLRGAPAQKDLEWQLIDTPGMYSFSCVSEEERVTRRILTDEQPELVIHVVDAKNLERMLTLTLELIEAKYSVILAVNMLDEAKKAGIQVDLVRLEEQLGIPVIGTVSTTGEGIEKLVSRAQQTLESPPPESPLAIKYSRRVEDALKHLAELLPPRAGLSARALGVLVLTEDEELLEQALVGLPHEVTQKIREIVRQTNHGHAYPLEYEVAIARRDQVTRILEGCVSFESRSTSFRERLSRLLINPITGLPVLLAILYFGLYKFVGVFGAGTVVDYLEGTLFEGYVNPFLSGIVNSVIPWQAIQDLFAGEYGLLTLGLRYAIAIILPIVGFFFLVFAVIEDSGYLPRLALLLDRTFKKIGLSGRGVIPMVLGLGCDTMATMVTRTLPTKRERLLSTILLALAVPCSAQLGVILALLSGRPAAMLVWAGVIVAIFLTIGWLGAQLLPGEGPSFYMELPPLRLPKLTNVLTKTYVRVKWYLQEVIPLFLAASVLIWIGQITGAFGAIIKALEPPVKMIGLPIESADIFLMGFFRRDYGAAGLYDLSKEGLLNGTQLVVAAVALTLFLPCIAQLLMNVKERGWKVGVGISGVVLVLSFGVAYLLNLTLTTFGVTL